MRDVACYCRLFHARLNQVLTSGEGVLQGFSGSQHHWCSIGVSHSGWGVVHPIQHQLDNRMLFFTPGYLVVQLRSLQPSTSWNMALKCSLDVHTLRTSSWVAGAISEVQGGASMASSDLLACMLHVWMFGTRILHGSASSFKAGSCRVKVVPDMGLSSLSAWQ